MNTVVQGNDAAVFVDSGLRRNDEIGPCRRGELIS
jgi:hypothetical protein